MAGPYGKPEEITVYVQQTDGTEKEFTDIEGGYNIDLTLNKVGTFSVTMEGLEEADKAYIAINNKALIFAGSRLVILGRINTLSYGNDNAVTFSGESLGDSKLMDHSTGSLLFTNVDSCAINACLLCTPGSNIISMGTNTNFGKISYRNEYDNVANALNKVAGAVGYDWWTANGGTACQAYAPSANCSGNYTQSGVKLITDADTIFNWTASAGACTVAVSTGNKREGYGSISMGGCGACTNFCYTHTITSGDTCLPFENFQWWLFVCDKTKLNATNPVRVCFYANATNEGYFVDLTCASLSNGWNLVGKTKTADFTPNASASASYGAIDRLRILIKPSNTGDLASGDLGIDYITNYEYGTQYWNTDVARGCPTQIMNDAEATTCWTANCPGPTADQVCAISTPTPKCGTNSISLIKNQTATADSCFSVAIPTGECFQNMKNKYFGFWFYLDCATCASLTTTAPLKVRIGCALPATTYKEYCWDCKDLSCGWNLLLADMKYPQSITGAASLNELTTNCMTFIIGTCAAACTIGCGKIMIDQVVNSIYGINFNGKNINAEGISNEADANSLANSITVLGAGDGINKLCSNTLGATCVRSCLAYGESFLALDLSSSATTACLYDTTGYPTAGTVCIDAECITYTGKTATTLTGLTRAAGSTTAKLHVCTSSVMNLTHLEAVSTAGFPSPAGCFCVGRERINYTGVSGNCFTTLTRGAGSTKCYAHIKNSEVYDGQYTAASCQACSSIACFGVRSVTVNCPNIIDQNLLDRTSQAIFANNSCPPKRIVARAMEPAFLERTFIGDTLITNDASAGTQGPFRVVRVRPMYSEDEGLAYEFELSNKKVGMVEELQKKADQINEQSQYMQGATNVYQLTSEDNVDSGFGVLLKFFMPDDTKAINCMKLSYDIGGYRTYHQTTGSCLEGSVAVPASSFDIETSGTGVKCCHVLSFTAVCGPIGGGTFSDHLFTLSYFNRSGVGNCTYDFKICDCTTPALILSCPTCSLANGAGVVYTVQDTTSRVGKTVAMITCCASINDEATGGYHTRAIHCHNVAYGITDTGSTISANAGGDTNIVILVDGTDQTTTIQTALGHCLQTSEPEISLLPFASFLTPGQFHCVEVRSCDGRGRIHANLYQKVYIESST
jgi:hypothetical protein